MVTASEVAAAAEKVAETQPTADQFASQAGVDDEKDEDLVRDLNRMRSQKQAPSEQTDQFASEQLAYCLSNILDLWCCRCFARHQLHVSLLFTPVILQIRRSL